MFQKVTLVVLLSSILIACASPRTWKKTDVSYEDTHTALAQCKYEIGINDVPSTRENEMVKHCMESKGFRWR